MPLGKPLLETLERMGCGGVIIDAEGRVLDLNLTAAGLLGATAPNDVREKLKAMLRAGDRRFRLDADNWIMVAREGKRPLALHAVPVADNPDRYSRTVLILVDLHDYPQPSSDTLQRMFGLTAGEAELAMLIARGETPRQIAIAKSVSMATVRTQLGAIFAKTGTTRQPELVALLARVAILP